MLGGKNKITYPQSNTHLGRPSTRCCSGDRLRARQLSPVDELTAVAAARPGAVGPRFKARAVRLAQ